jgi:uncharacterized protein (UPF0332 family)
VAVLNSDHLFEQAEKLVAPPQAGPPRQVDLRRAISAVYYAVFHYILTAAADDFVGVTKRNTRRYILVYRHIDHRTLRDLCIEMKKSALPVKYQRYAPASGMGPNIQAFASAVIDLQEKRHSADYDPSARLKTSDAKLAIATGRSAIKRFEKASESRRKAFLALLLFPPR